MELPVQILFQNCLDRLGDLYDDRETKTIVKILLEDKFGITTMDQMMKKSVLVDERELNSSVNRLKQMEPVQYVNGIADFLNRKFKVASGVLIPRPETEELVNWIIDSNKVESPAIWDIGSGSGCIAISLDLGISDSKTIGTDLSKTVISIGESNNTNLGAKVEFVQSDIFEDEFSTQEFDIIVSNPPYIPEEEKESIDTNVKAFEPREALFVPDNDPLLFYKRIAELGIEKLKKGGYLYFEIHENFALEVLDLLQNMNYIDVEIREDMQGKERMVRARNF